MYSSYGTWSGEWWNIQSFSQDSFLWLRKLVLISTSLTTIFWVVLHLTRRYLVYSVVLLSRSIAVISPICVAAAILFSGIPTLTSGSRDRSPDSLIAPITGILILMQCLFSIVLNQVLILWVVTRILSRTSCCLAFPRSILLSMHWSGIWAVDLAGWYELLTTQSKH